MSVWNKVVIGVLVLAVVFGVGVVVGMNSVEKCPTSSVGGQDIGDVLSKILHPYAKCGDWSLLDEINAVVRAHYYKPDAVTATAMLDGAAHGLVNSLPDPYSAYLDPQELEEMNQVISGHYGGIGVLVTEDKEGRGIAISKVFPGTPAEKAGLKSGDIIVAVNGEDIAGQPLELVASKIRGPAGTKVKLTILRDDETFDVEVERAQIEIPAVLESKWLNVGGKKVGYIDFGTQFFSGSSSKVADKIKWFEDHGADYVILDIRGNPGGLVSEVSRLLGYFVPGKHILTIRYRDGEENLNAPHMPYQINVPIILLVNHWSASASEIFTADMKYYQKAYVIGEKTYGKGTVQEIFDVSKGAVKLTVAEYITAGGFHVDGKGVVPNLTAPDDPNTPEDETLEAAEKYIERH